MSLRAHPLIRTTCLDTKYGSKIIKLFGFGHLLGSGLLVRVAYKSYLFYFFRALTLFSFTKDKHPILALSWLYKKV